MLRPYTVLVIMDRLNAWRELCTRHPSMRFCQTFISEAEKRGVLVHQAITESTPYAERVHPSGMRTIVNRIRQMSDTFLGALIVGTRAQIPDLERWIATFARLRKPLVWFDQRNEGLPTAVPHPRGGFTRCCFDDCMVSDVTVKVLAELEHCVVGYPLPETDMHIQHTYERLEHMSNFHIVSHAFPGDFWKRVFSAADVFSELRRLALRGMPHVRAALSPYLTMNRGAAIRALRQFSKHTRGCIVSLSPVLAPYLVEKRLTALIAPDNQWARQYYYWLKAAGVQIPHDLSLLSFGNDLESQALPISTIDYGFDTLGYSAIHAILGDIPLSRDQHRSIAARPRVINRGSLARPRTGPISVRPVGDLW
jgi:hypothetical protein